MNRRLKCAGIRYDLYERDTPEAWILLHGWLQGRRFQDQCKMHDLVTTVYPIGPWWNWGGHLQDRVAEVIWEVKRRTGCRKIVLGGFSDGATWCHSYWVSVVDCLVHYAGLWKNVTAPRPCVCFCGSDDRLQRIVDESKEAADSYGTILHLIPGGHEWNSRSNEYIQELVSRKLYDQGVAI